MIYGLYLSAAGVQTNSYRQDVIANNIANAETVGFKKDLALFDQRLTDRLGDQLFGDILHDLRFESLLDHVGRDLARTEAGDPRLASTRQVRSPACAASGSSS